MRHWACAWLCVYSSGCCSLWLKWKFERLPWLPQVCEHSAHGDQSERMQLTGQSTTQLSDSPWLLIWPSWRKQERSCEEDSLIISTNKEKGSVHIILFWIGISSKQAFYMLLSYIMNSFWSSAWRAAKTPSRSPASDAAFVWDLCELKRLWNKLNCCYNWEKLLDFCSISAICNIISILLLELIQLKPERKQHQIDLLPLTLIHVSGTCVGTELSTSNSLGFHCFITLHKKEKTCGQHL